ncbi:hypothetical protein [Streptomyces sp. NBC_01751]|uniref:hypothetical protein n=1 Tax=Streptomyces sp. NBC_01751 TaxID=2975929 RepID=UPI002DDAC6FB|nr:hypothetical protein [Streptomyces sp. NBC_01751]WSD23348.1 hypothetical protein OHA26_07590 [Streptomyces sp. NBC_01751]
MAWNYREDMMLVDTFGLDLNDAGIDLQGIDILWDVPQVISVARIRFSNGTRLEIAHCPRYSDGHDMQLAREMIPNNALRLRAVDTDTLGCMHGDEYTVAFWIFE